MLLHFQTMNQLELPMDDRDQMRAMDLMNSVLHGEVKDTLEDKRDMYQELLEPCRHPQIRLRKPAGKTRKDIVHTISS